MDQAHQPAESRRDVIVVSPELTILVGRGAFADVAPPLEAIGAAYGLGAIGTAATVALASGEAVAALLRQDDPTTRIVLLVAPAVIDRLGAQMPADGAQRQHHLASELRAIALALRDCDRPGESGDIYRAAKGVELLCETFRMLGAGALVSFAGEGGLSRADSVRILAARQVIDERWAEKLPLERIAALCGLNREKLTRGFREMFDCTIAEAIAERRLLEASRMLLTTDLPVALIGYDNGYLNNASFTRAFGRRFGVTPSDYRASRLAA